MATHLSEIDAREINSIPLGNGSDGEPIVARVGRYGPYLQRGEDRASIPDDMAPDELTIERAEEILAAPSNDRVLGTHPETGLDVQVKAGRFGPYVQVGEVVEGGDKPRTASLFSSMEPTTLTLEQALQLLQIPRVIGTDPETDEDVVAHNGRFGPYLKRGADTRSLGSEEQLLTVTLPEAQALFAQPKQRRGRASAAPLRELGTDPTTNLPCTSSRTVARNLISQSRLASSPSPSPSRPSLSDCNISSLLPVPDPSFSTPACLSDSFVLFDNAAGIAEMSGEFTGEAERVMVSLDAVGNTTKAITKGVAIGSAVIASVALFASFIETIGEQLPSLHATGAKLFSIIQINVANPTTFIGLLIGGSIAFLFSSLAIRAVGRSAGTVVLEVRRQFREHPGIMDYTEKPEYGRVISICTAAAQRELATPALLAILAPVIVGFGINYLALGAFLAGTILTGQLLANTLSNSGGAWDNAKKYIEDGNEGGKGSEAHKAAVIGDTVGDPFKDTAGPALNPMIKVMNLVSLLILPAVISLQHHTGARLAIAGVSLVILLGALAFSKRGSEAMDADSADSAPAVAAVAPVE